MTSGPGTYAAELIQLRNASASEALAIFHAQMRTFKSRLTAVGGNRLSRAALLVVAGIVGAILMMAVESPWVRSLPTIYTLSAIVFVAAVGMRIWVHFHYKRCAEVYRHCFRADRTFRLEEHAIVATNALGVVSSVPWRAIFDIVADKDFLAIYLSPVEVLFLPKAACEHQDAERFCAELVRRWQAHRSLAGAGA